MQIKDAGIYPDLPMAEYIADPCPDPSVSRGLIQRIVMRTPAHAKHDHPRLGNPEPDDSPKADRGSAAHGLRLGGAERIVWVDKIKDRKTGEMVSAKDFKTKAAKKIRDDAHAEGNIPMLEKDRAGVEAMVRIAEAEMGALASEMGGHGLGVTENTLCWREGDDWARCRPDWFEIVLAAALAIDIDYKTTEIQGGPEAFIRGMAGSGYDIGARWQSRGLRALVPGVGRVEFSFLVQETFKPYCCYSVALDEQMVEMGDEKIEMGLALWRQSKAAGSWDGYPKEIHWATPPTHTVYDWEARKAMIQMRLRGEVS